MGAVKVKTVNDQLLNLGYSEERIIRMFLKHWTGLESLSLKGDSVATCILLDLKSTTGIDLEPFVKSNMDRYLFEQCNHNGILSYHQFISIAYVLVLGYTQEEVASMLKCTQQAVNKNIRKGIVKIQTALMAYRED